MPDPTPLSAWTKLLCFLKRYGIVLTARAVFFYLRQRLGDRLRLFLHGKSLNKNSCLSDTLLSGPPRVLFLTFSYESGSKLYRVAHIVEYLKAAGWFADILHIEDLQRIWAYALSFEVIVISHLPLNPTLQRFVDAARSSKRIVVYGMDDPLFLSDVLRKFFRLPSEFGSREKEFYYKEADQRMALMKQCDCFLASTHYLARQAEGVGLPAYIIRNGLSRNSILASARALSQKAQLQSRNASTTIIGYFSGTRTHDHDFTFATEALLRILDEYSFVQLWIHGYLDLDSRFRRFGYRVKLHPLTSWLRMFADITRVNINIAPLELHSQLTDPKSEVKYIEAALVKVPTIASATDTFSRVITPGVTGFLARSDDDWYEHLKRLIVNPSEQQRIAEAAYRHVMTAYSPEAMSSQAVEIFQTIMIKHAYPDAD